MREGITEARGALLQELLACAIKPSPVLQQERTNKITKHISPVPDGFHRSGGNDLGGSGSQMAENGK